MSGGLLLTVICVFPVVAFVKNTLSQPMCQQQSLYLEMTK
jgi:hypothetical protein